MTRKTARFRFFGSLNDFLPPQRREVDFPLDFQGDQSVKHLFESCGAPHTEVSQVFANGTLVDQNYIVQDGDRIEVHPLTDPFRGQEAGSISQADPPRFVLDNHLGKLAAYLRLLGFDVIYRNDLQDEELAHLSSQEGRILLTRDRRLLMRTTVTQGYCVRALLSRQQALEVLQRYDLFSAITPFGRCVHCNALLQPVHKAEIIDRLEPLTRRYFNEFQRCPACDQVYWKGSHYDHFQSFITELLQHSA